MKNAYGCKRGAALALLALAMCARWSTDAFAQIQTTNDSDRNIKILKNWRQARAEAVIAAAEQLGASGAAAADAVPALIPLLDRDTAFRQPAIRSLAKIGAPAVPELLRLLDGPKEALVMGEEIRRDQVLGCMEVFNAMEVKLRREVVIPGLSTLMTNAVQVAKNKKSSTAEAVWLNAVDCLAALGPESVPILQGALKDGYNEDFLAKKIGKDAISAYAAMKSTIQTEHKWTQFYGLVLTQPGLERIPDLLEWMNKDEYGFLPYLGMILKRMGTESVRPLSEKLADKGQDWYLRDGIALTFEMMGPKATTALPVLERVCQDTSDDVLVRISAARAIANVKGINPFEVYKHVPELEKNVLETTRKKSTSWRNAYMKREGARTDYATESSDTVGSWNTTCWWVHAMLSGENLALANRSIKAAAEIGTIGSFMDVNMVRVFVTCHSKSSFFPGRLTPDTEAALKEYFFRKCNGSPDGKAKGFNNMSTEDLHKAGDGWGLNANLPMNGTTRDYLSLGVLKDDPTYKDRKFHAGDTVSERYEAWNALWKQFLKAWALNGLWYELGSGLYTYHTYPSYFNLADLSPDPVVRQRARMWLDLSFIESEQMSISRLRGGSKSRSKSGGLGSTFDSYAAMLYGERGAIRFHGSIAASSYQPPEAAVLLRKLGPISPCFEIANRHQGEFTFELDKESGKRAVKYVRESHNVNYGYRTPEYVIGCAMYNPNLDYSDGTCGRWSGVLFRDLGAISLEAYTGEKWNVQSKDVMIAQRRMGKAYKYRGRSKIVFESVFESKIERDGWVFVDNGEAYAAVNVVQGGAFWGDPIKRTLYPKDDYSPIIIQTGRKAEYGTFKAFQEAVLKALLELKEGRLTYLGPKSSKLEFFLATSTGEQVLPKIDGKTIDLDLKYSYKSPYLESAAGSDRVTVSYGAKKWLYDFKNNTVTETHP